MVVYSIGCDFVKPVSKLLLITSESVKIFNDAQKHLRSYIFGSLPLEEPVHTVAKYRVVVSAIQPGKSCRVATGVGY